MKCPKCQSDNPSDSGFCSKCGTQLLPSEEISVSHTAETLETPSEELTRGTTFANRYEIIEELGKGGMGKVYRVEDKKIREEVALKLIKSEISADKKTIERFSSELKLARKIRHKNVCGMYDLGEEKGAHYITMEYVPGEDLKSFIRRSGQLAAGTTIRIAKQVFDGLAEAHRLGTVHRDLKPSNIMIDKEGNARIMDFGIARSLKTKGITGAGVMIGTPDYMSPEQVEGKEVDPRSDIYSLGVILYEMVTGRVPFEGDTPLSIAIKQKTETPKNPIELNAQIPNDLSHLILKCLEKDKEKRYQSAGEVRTELEQIEQGLPTTERIEPTKKPATSKEITVTFRKRWIMVTALIVAVIVVGAAILYFRSEKPLLSHAKKRLLVLPFKNLGLPEDEYFADSITEEIRARLTQIERLSIIARTSAYQYKNTEKSIRKIGEELEVDYILDGTIRWQKSPDGSSQVRVIPELIRASDSTNLWTEVYDKDITDIFEVQSDIADQAAKALDIVLSEPERQALKFAPTDNLDAYHYYLRGINYSNRSMDKQDSLTAVQMFEKAVGLDNAFVIAYARLSRALIALYWFYYDRTEECLVKAKEAVDKALSLNPDLPEAHFALGMYYYRGLSDYENALEQFGIVQKSQPNNSDILSAIGFIKRRQGKFEECLATLKKAFELDPLSYRKAISLVDTYSLMRLYLDAERCVDLAISLSPDLSRPYVYKAWVYLSWMGNAEKAREVMEDAPREITDPGLVFPTWTLIDVIDGNYQKALERLSSESSEYFESGFYFIPKVQLYAQIYGLMNQTQLEKAYYDSSGKILEAKIREQPEDARLHSALGIAFAGLGRKQKAIKEAEKAVELLPVSKDAYRGTFRVEDLARVYVMVGEYDSAIDQLEFLLSIPSWMSKHLLRIDPVWDPLHSHPRFQKLFEEKNNF